MVSHTRCHTKIALFSELLFSKSTFNLVHSLELFYRSQHLYIKHCIFHSIHPLLTDIQAVPSFCSHFLHLQMVAWNICTHSKHHYNQEIKHSCHCNPKSPATVSESADRCLSPELCPFSKHHINAVTPFNLLCVASLTRHNASESHLCDCRHQHSLLGDGRGVLLGVGIRCASPVRLSICLCFSHLSFCSLNCGRSLCPPSHCVIPFLVDSENYSVCSFSA